MNSNPWLPFPQSTCPFGFGDDSRPLPIGALFILWERDPRWRGPCTRCGGDLRGLLTGGLLSFSWFEKICLDCEHSFSIVEQGSIGDAADRFRTKLQDTEFHIGHGWFGGAVKSDGSELQRLLGVSYRSGGEVSYTIHTGSGDDGTSDDDTGAEGDSSKRRDS